MSSRASNPLSIAVLVSFVLGLFIAVPEPMRAASNTVAEGIIGSHRVPTEQLFLDVAPGQWLVNPANGHGYTLTDDWSTFPEYEAQAVAWGGHLVTINDQDEQNWLYETFGEFDYLIGINDLDEEGDFVWVSGQPVTYTNWCSGEPNDVNEGEDVVSMIKNFDALCWNDVPTPARSGIVETDSPPPANIRASASNNPDRVEGHNFAPDTTLVLTVDTGAGPVAVLDPPTTDSFGNFNYGYNPDLDLDPGDVVAVSDGATTRTLTLVGLTFDVLDYDTDTASGTSDQPDGTPIDVNVGNMSGGENVTTTVTSGEWNATFTNDITTDMGGQAAINDTDGDQTFADSPQPPNIRASASNNPDRVEGYNFAPDTEMTLSVNSVAVLDPPTTDSFGNFNYGYNPDLDLDPGDVVAVSDGATTRTLTLVGLTFDVLDYDTDTASGTSDQPDGTPIDVNVGNMSGGENVTTTVTSGEWNATFTNDITTDMGGQAAINDTDGDQTFADSPQPPNIRASASNNPDRVEGYNFAPDTEMTLSVNSVAVLDPPTTDSFGNFNYGYNPDLDLDPGDVVAVSDGATTRTLTLVGLTFDVLDYDTDTASGTSDQPDGTPIDVNVGNMSGGENVTTTVTSGEWNATFTNDITTDMGGQAAINDTDGDQTFADAPQPPNIQASASNNPDRVQGYNFAPDTTLVLTVDTGAGPVAVLDPPTTDSFGNFNYDHNPDLDLQPGDVVEVSDGATTRTLTLVGLTFDVLDYDTDTASGTSDQPDGTVVNVGVGNMSGGENIEVMLSGGAWAVEFTIDVTTDMGGQAAINDTDGDQTFADSPQPPNIRASASNNPDRVEGYNFAPDTEMTLSVNSVAVLDPPTTDSFGNFNYDYNPDLDLQPGDVVAVSDGATTRTLTLVGLTFDVLDYDTDTASGTSDQPDGTPVHVNVGNMSGGENVTTTVTSGEWNATFTIDVAIPVGGQVAISEPDGDQTFADSPQLPPAPHIWASAADDPDGVLGFSFLPDTTVVLTVDTGAGPVAVLDPPTTDSFGNFNYGYNPDFDLDPGDVVEVSDGATTRTLTLVGLTFDVLDYDTDTASGTSDQPDGTPVHVNVGNDMGGENVTTTVTSGEWNATFTIDITGSYQWAFATIYDDDGDATVDAPDASLSTPFDFDGDGSADRGVYRPEYGGWYIDGLATEFIGLSTDVPVPGDYDGDEVTERAVFRDGAWFIEGESTRFLGQAGDIPVPGDYDGDGDWEPAVFRDGAWFIEGQATAYFGLPSDVPVPADYNGDGLTEIAVFRPSVGGWYVNGLAPVFYGLPTDVPVPADYDGDGVVDRAVFRPEYGGWYVDGLATEFIGLSFDVPVPADYDGDGAAERAVYRPAYGGWYVEDATTVFYGLGSDIPLLLPAAVYNSYYTPS